eukprot:757615-Hanusia_phi.AAC.3
MPHDDVQGDDSWFPWKLPPVHDQPSCGQLETVNGSPGSGSPGRGGPAAAPAAGPQFTVFRYRRFIPFVAVRL